MPKAATGKRGVGKVEKVKRGKKGMFSPMSLLLIRHSISKLLTNVVP
jgi:hypothetical protein